MLGSTHSAVGKACYYRGKHMGVFKMKRNQEIMLKCFHKIPLQLYIFFVFQILVKSKEKIIVLRTEDEQGESYCFMSQNITKMTAIKLQLAKVCFIPGFQALKKTHKELFRILIYMYI